MPRALCPFVSIAAQSQTNDGDLHVGNDDLATLAVYPVRTIRRDYIIKRVFGLLVNHLIPDDGVVHYISLSSKFCGTIHIYTNYICHCVM